MLRFRLLLVAAGLAAACALRGQNPTFSSALFGGYINPDSSQEIYMYFVVEGGSDEVLIRETGPTLPQIAPGYAGLPDPQLELFGVNESLIASNAGWTTDPNQIDSLDSAFSSANAYRYPSDSADSAMVVTLNPGAYIIHFMSAQGNTGYIFGELYDLSTGGRVVYASEAAQNQQMNFTNHLSATDTVLVRGLGPSLGSDYGGTAPTEFVLTPSNLAPIPVTDAFIGSAGTFPLLPATAEAELAVSYVGDLNIVAGKSSDNSGYLYLEFSIADALRQNLAPVYLLPPSGGSFGVGATLQLIAPFVAWPAPTSYVWSKDGAALPGQTNSSLLIRSLQAGDAGSYTLTITNAAGSVVTPPAQVIVEAPVTFTQQPTNQFANPGGSATFTLGATGTGTVTYQWYFNGSPISGATNSSLTLTNITSAAFGNYVAYVTDNAGTTQSNAVTLSLGYSRIINLSALSTAGDVAPGVQIGFVVGGTGTTGTTPFLVRAIGPSLAPFGVTRTLADPNITVYDNSKVAIGTNDNWGTNAAAITAADSAVNAFALTDPASLDAAFTSAFSSGPYTADLGGPGSGKALAELYDETPNAGPTAPRLINISARAQVSPGAPLTAGFTLSGTGTKQLLIRGIGPRLADFGVANVLATPTLTVYDAHSTPLATNTGWGSDANIAAAAANVLAFSLPANSPDCALLISLPPGVYTAAVSGVSSASGDALIEVYEVQ